MNDPSLSFVDKTEPTSVVGRILRFPLVLLALYAVVLAALMIGLVQVQSSALGYAEPWQTPWFNLVATALFVGVYALMVRILERRPLSEFAWRGALLESCIGAGVQACLVIAMMGVIALFGAYVIVSARLPAGLDVTVTWLLFVAVNEEIGHRAVIFRLSEQLIGSWAALILSGMIFGATHLGNPSATWIGAVAIALESGVLDGALFMATRRLWIVIAGHFAWNFMEGPVFGAPVSGYNFSSFLSSASGGPQWATGGQFGPEASLAAVLLCVPAGIVVAVIAFRNGQFIAPYWSRDRTRYPQ